MKTNKVSSHHDNPIEIDEDKKYIVSFNNGRNCTMLIAGYLFAKTMESATYAKKHKVI